MWPSTAELMTCQQEGMIVVFQPFKVWRTSLCWTCLSWLTFACLLLTWQSWNQWSLRTWNQSNTRMPLTNQVSMTWPGTILVLFRESSGEKPSTKSSERWMRWECGRKSKGPPYPRIEGSSSASGSLISREVLADSEPGWLPVAIARLEALTSPKFSVQLWMMWLSGSCWWQKWSGNLTVTSLMLKLPFYWASWMRRSTCRFHQEWRQMVMSVYYWWRPVTAWFRQQFSSLSSGRTFWSTNWDLRAVWLIHVFSTEVLEGTLSSSVYMLMMGMPLAEKKIFSGSLRKWELRKSKSPLKSHLVTTWAVRWNSTRICPRPG